MSRCKPMCEYCKLDKVCDYSHIKRKLAGSLLICPMFIYENGKPITNAERLSKLLMVNDNTVDSASYEIWNMTKLNDEFEDYHQLRDWLKEECEELKCINR